MRVILWGTNSLLSICLFWRRAPGRKLPAAPSLHSSGVQTLDLSQLLLQRTLHCINVCMWKSLHFLLTWTGSASVLGWDPASVRTGRRKLFPMAHSHVSLRRQRQNPFWIRTKVTLFMLNNPHLSGPHHCEKLGHLGDR